MELPSNDSSGEVLEGKRIIRRGRKVSRIRTALRKCCQAHPFLSALPE